MKYVKDSIVEVTVRGKVTHDYGTNVLIHTKAGNAVQVYKADVEIKVVETPLELFGPGSVVKHKESLRIYTVLPDGEMFDHENGRTTAYPANWVLSDTFKRLA